MVGLPYVSRALQWQRIATARDLNHFIALTTPCVPPNKCGGRTCDSETKRSEERKKAGGAEAEAHTPEERASYAEPQARREGGEAEARATPPTQPPAQTQQEQQETQQEMLQVQQETLQEQQEPEEKEEEPR